VGDKNHVELDWGVDSITVGTRHRKDLGDLDALRTSIAEHGLLQPITVTQNGLLICGARRLAAVKQLGWKVVNVWVKADLSTKLTSFMAEREDQTTQKAYTVGEMADLYEELKQEIAADAARRQKAGQFGPGIENPRFDGGANFAPPSDEPTEPGQDGWLDGGAKFAPPSPSDMKTRKQAADMVGGASYGTLDKVVAMRQIAADTTRSDVIRAQATEALQQVEAGEPVEPLFLALRSVVRIDDLDRIATDEAEPPEARETAERGVILLRKLEAANAQPAELDKSARAALDRVKAIKQPPKPAKVRAEPKPPAPIRRPLKWFTWTWHELSGWTSQIDAGMVAAGITDQQWEEFAAFITETLAFRDTVAGLRAQL